MIIITESNTQKIPGKTSLFIQFNYNADIINAIKTNTSVMNYDKETHIWEVPITCLHKLLGILNEIDDVTINFCDQVEEPDKEVILDTKNFLTKPYDYQLDGIKYGETHDKWLLLDAPGLGKTIETIYLAQELKEKQGLEHCFIICGLNTLKNNWKKEIHKHSNLSCRILGEKKLKNGKITIGSVQERIEQLKNPIDEFFVITNIETLRSNDIIKYMEHGPNKFDMLILDEAHTCFDYDTEVQTDIGNLKIGDIVDNKIKCKVLSFDGKQNQYENILNYNKFYATDMVELTFADGDDIRTLKCTPTHKIYTVNRGYVPAMELTENDEVVFNKDI